MQRILITAASDLNATPPPSAACTPPTKHDACGVGFVAPYPGRKAHGIIEQGLARSRKEPRPSRRRRRRQADGRRRGHPDPDPRRVLPRRIGRGVELPPPGEIRRRHDLPCRRKTCVAAWPANRRSSARSRPRAEVARLARRAGRQDDAGLSPTVRAKEPVIRQVFIGAARTSSSPTRWSASSTSSARRRRADPEPEAHAQALLHVPSIDVARTVVYKGLLLADQVGVYTDLQDPRVVSALALVHQRFSTNNLPPEWPLAHPTGWWRPQRRDQHRQGQLQLDARPRGRDEVAGARRRPREALSDHL